ncbi:hypothetical protein [Zavarzinia compransoris]|uniref:DnaA N-terminal domain-containing protein n=1 Tax=Zavarzinia compransoris TaxID=1264899 RepID=A0A317EDD2_9PROT|nr:hypothetical protein [Zavarzinia compransoris]PWR23373.1 hypothetical protein DKG75_02045 [Zavarzinia compransoris]TDP46054.1 hypothetical protein DES42_104135 [Zavarzinia compransoris]
MMKKLPARLEEPFARFWKVFPKRVQPLRRSAEDGFAKAVARGADPEFLIRAAGLFAAQVKAEDMPRKFFPLAATWLHQERFADYAEEHAAPAPAAAPEGIDPTGGRLLAAGIEQSSIVAWFEGVEMSVDAAARQLTVVAPKAFALDQIKARFDRHLHEAFGVTSVVYRKAGGPGHGLA